MPTPAQRRYNHRVLRLSAAYGLLLIGAAWAFAHHHATGPLAWAAAILPALPIVGIFAAIGRYLAEERDEYVRMVMVRQTLWASGFSLSIATVWGFLEAFELVRHLPAYAVAVMWFAGLGLGAVANRLTVGRSA